MADGTQTVSPAEATHPDFDAWLPSWVEMRDTADGAEAVKAKTTGYLPKPSGFEATTNPETGNNAYSAYLTRAQFPELVAPTIRGLDGVIHAKPATINLPEALEPLRERATRDGLTLEGLHQLVTREILTTGRYGLMSDVQENGTPYLAGYIAETITNWGQSDDKKIAFVTLDESGNDFDPESLAWDESERWRVVDLFGGSALVRKFEKVNDRINEIEQVSLSFLGGKPLDFVPFVFIDTNNLTPTPEEVPLLPLARVALAIYRLDADYRHQLYMTGQEMLVFTGCDEDHVPDVIGAGFAINLPQGATATIIGPKGTGIAAHRLAIEDEKQRAIAAGAQLIADTVASNESGEAKRLRLNNQHATLKSISKAAAAGLERALRNCAMWIGADPEKVEVVPNLEFADVRLTPQEIDSLVKGWQGGAYSKLTLYENLQKGGIANPERSFDDEELLIENEVPALGVMEEEPDGEPEDEDGTDDDEIDDDAVNE